MRNLSMCRLVFLAILFYTGCSQVPCHLPQPEFEWQKGAFDHYLQEDFSPPNHGQWFYYLKLAQSFQESTTKYLGEGTTQIYPIVIQKRNMPYLPVLSNSAEQFIFIELAVNELLFKDHQVSPATAQVLTKLWENLLKAEYYNLYAAVIIAELQEKWDAGHHNCTSEPDKQKEAIAHGLDSLPSLQTMEEQKKNILLLIKALRQLAIANETIQIPSWEIIRRENKLP